MTRILASPMLARCENSLTELMNFLPGFQAALDAEADDAAEAALEVLRGELVVRIVRQPGISHPVHQRMGLEKLRDLQRVLRMLSLPQRQRFQTLQEQERVERAQGTRRCRAAAARAS